MLSRLETEREIITEFGPSMRVKGEVIKYRIFDDVTEYMGVLWDQGAVHVEPQYLGGKRINLQSVWDNSGQPVVLQTPLNEGPARVDLDSLTDLQF